MKRLSVVHHILLPADGTLFFFVLHVILVFFRIVFQFLVFCRRNGTQVGIAISKLNVTFFTTSVSVLLFLEGSFEIWGSRNINFVVVVVILILIRFFFIALAALKAFIILLR